MKQINLGEARAKLSRLVDQAAKGKGVIIAKAGIPMAKLVPLDSGDPKKKVQIRNSEGSLQRGSGQSNRGTPTGRNPRVNAEWAYLAGQ